MDKARCVKIGSVIVGAGYPVAVQTMWKEALSLDLEAVTARIQRLESLGCSILRFAVPDIDAAQLLGALASRVKMPLVADIHFDWRIALRCLDFPIAKIRVNPGNIGASWKVEEVTRKAFDKGVPIRIGVNSGSLPKDLERRAASGDTSGALVEAAEREVAELDRYGFRDVLVSMKASNVPDTVSANELFASRSDVPLHIGVTEAGPLVQGVARSAIALYALVSKGIGATLRVSLSSEMENEVIAGKEIVALATGKRSGVNLVSCPRCGRASFDTHAFTARWQERLYSLGKDVTVAVMGCVVNGPGEARHADLGITGAGDKVVVFRHGEILRTCAKEDADTVFEEALSKL